jgi:hypothetical protein
VWKTQILDSYFKSGNIHPQCNLHVEDTNSNCSKSGKMHKSIQKQVMNEMREGGNEVQGYIMLGHCMR